MNRFSMMAMVLILLLAGCSDQERSGPPTTAPPETEPAASTTTAEIPVLEPTVRDRTLQTPEEVSRAQQELDAQCAQMDIQEAQEMGIAPEEYGCEPDGTGIPVREWVEQNE